MESLSSFAYSSSGDVSLSISIIESEKSMKPSLVYGILSAILILFIRLITYSGIGYLIYDFLFKIQ